MTDLAGHDRAAIGRVIIETMHEPDTVVLKIYGELDLASVPELERELEVAQALHPARIEFVLDGVSFMDSTGLRALLRTVKAAETNGYEFVLRGVPEQARRVLEVSGALGLFTVVD
jgi:anti-sigma B factor antagonist